MVGTLASVCSVNWNQSFYVPRWKEPDVIAGRINFISYINGQRYTHRLHSTFHHEIIKVFKELQRTGMRIKLSYSGGNDSSMARFMHGHVPTRSRMLHPLPPGCCKVLFAFISVALRSRHDTVTKWRSWRACGDANWGTNASKKLLLANSLKRTLKMHKRLKQNVFKFGDVTFVSVCIWLKYRRLCASYMIDALI